MIGHRAAFGDDDGPRAGEGLFRCAEEASGPRLSRHSFFRTLRGDLLRTARHGGSTPRALGHPHRKPAGRPGCQPEEAIHHPYRLGAAASRAPDAIGAAPGQTYRVRVARREPQRAGRGEFLEKLDAAERHAGQAVKAYHAALALEVSYMATRVKLASLAEPEDRVVEVIAMWRRIALDVPAGTHREGTLSQFRWLALRSSGGSSARPR